MNIIVRNLLVTYFDGGPPHAPTVVLLHGWGATAQNFDGLAAHLAGRFRVVRFDLPGFGGSQVPPAAWHIKDYAVFVSAVLEKLGISRVEAIIGHSFGGRIILKAAGQGILKPERIVLMGSAGVKHSNTLRNQVFKAVAKTGKAATSLPGMSRLQAKLRSRLYQAAGSSDYLTSGSLRQTFINTINEDLQPDAATIKIPALLIWGENDTDTPPADGRLLAAAIAHSTFHLIPGAGHYVHLDAPDTVQQHIDAFLQ